MAEWVMPTSGSITSTPGYRVPPVAGASSNHKGWDIAAPSGTNVYAASYGTVEYAGYAKGYGNVVYIRHPDGSQTRYAHLMGFNVRPGQQVSAGQRIGLVGNTGASSGPHLHYERRDKYGRVTQPFGDSRLNSQMKKGAKVKGGERGDGTEEEDDGKKGDQEGNTDTEDANSQRDKSEDPLTPQEMRDIKGSVNNYEVTITRSIVSRLPTHEPWIGHPRSTVGPRYGIGSQENGSSGNGDGGLGGVGGPGDFTGGPMAQGNATFDDYAPRIMNDLIRDFGFTPEQAAGIVGNLGHESGGFRQMQELRPISGRGGYGWAQWTGPRRKAFENYASSRGLPLNSYEANYGFLKYELMTTEKQAVSAVKNAKTVEQAAYAFERSFERAGIKHDESRYRWSRRAKKLFDDKNGATDPETADPGMNKEAADQKPSAPSSGTNRGGAAPSGVSSEPMV